MEKQKELRREKLPYRVPKMVEYGTLIGLTAGGG